MTTDRACGTTGAMSLRPVLVSVVNERKRSSTQVRDAAASTAAMNEPGHTALDRDVEIGERPRHNGERCAGGEELIGRHDSVAEHVPDESVGRVEVERGVEKARRERHLAAGRVGRLEDGQHGDRDPEQDRDPRQRGRRADGPDGEQQDQQPEEPEERASAGGIDKRVEDDPEELDRQKDGGRVASEEYHPTADVHGQVFAPPVTAIVSPVT